jgi:SET domain-containing protein
MDPKGWPASLRYLSKAQWADNVDKNAKTAAVQELKSFARLQGAVALDPAGRCRHLRIRVIEEQGHPAFGQRGLFAARNIPPRTFLLEYAGEITLDQCLGSDYVVALNHAVSIDAQRLGNEARFVNDYRGIAVKPNAEFRLFTYGGGTGEARMGIWSGHHNITKGSEILVSYGKAFWKSRTVNKENE